MVQKEKYSDQAMNIEEISKIFQPPQDLVMQFKDKIKAAGVDIEELPRAKYFLAARNDSTVLVLAHESAESVRWWGLGRDLVERVQEVDDVKANRTQWGAALLDGHPTKGYWIWGHDLSKLKEIRGLGLDKTGRQYHFNGDELDRHPSLVKSFFTIERFLRTVGL